MSPSAFYQYVKSENKVKPFYIFAIRNRGLPMRRLLMDAGVDFAADINVPIYAHDQPPVAESEIHLTYCDDENVNANRRVIPDFGFDSWADARIPSYTEKVAQIVESSKTPFVIDKAFWIGNQYEHITRTLLVRHSQENPNLDARHQGTFSDSDTFIPLEDHCRYSILIDVRGNGYSGRLKMLTFSGRPLLVQDRVYKDYALKQLTPWVHYIPFAEDLSDLDEKIDWAMTHREEAANIAKAAQDFAIANFTRAKAVESLRATLTAIASL